MPRQFIIAGTTNASKYLLDVTGEPKEEMYPGCFPVTDLQALMRGATAREFDLVAAWSVDRLGRSLQHLVQLFAEFQALNVDLYLHQQHVDSSTPSGRALLQMSGVFAEFERAILKERIYAGLARARAEGKHLGRRRTPGATDAAILTLREQGLGILKIGRKLRCGTARVQATLRAAS